MDFSLLQRLNDLLAGHDALEDPLLLYANASELLFLGMLVLVFLVVRGGPVTEVRRAVVGAGLSAALGLALAQVVSRLVDRPRPFVAHPHAVHLFAHHAPDPGFPSDHTTAAFAIAVALLLRFRAWGVVTLIFATILAFARVALGVHYPTDVLAGAALGTLSALALHHPAVRARLDRLADVAGAVLDAVVRGTIGRVAAPRS